MPSISEKGWTVTCEKRPILNAAEIDAAEARLSIPVPEMIFGNNIIKIEHEASGWNIVFDAINALDLVDKSGEPSGLVVAHSKHWLATREETAEEEIQIINKPFDWTYSPKYLGDVNQGSCKASWEPCPEPLPLDKLTLPDPILFFDDMVLYEDELADNGSAVLSVKIRVMPKRLLLLSRFFLRVDGVKFRIRDTRVYIEFEEGLVVREYQTQEEDYDKVKKRVRGAINGDYGQFLRDVNWVSKNMPTNEVERQKMVVS